MQIPRSSAVRWMGLCALALFASGCLDEAATVEVAKPLATVDVTFSEATVGEAGLDFQGSASTTGTVRFQFMNPLAIYPATYIWKVYPRRQSGHYTAFYWGNNGTFYWDKGSPNTYYDARPYPSGNGHRWQLGADAGNYVNDANGNSTTVAYDRWHTQALRVWSDASGNKHHEFYWDLPDTSRVIRVAVPSRYGNTNPPSPVLAWGDAPSNPSNQIFNGVLRGIQVYAATLSVSDVLAEMASPMSTAQGASSIWYLNLDPTPSDISDKSGRGHHPAWVGSERPLLWNGQPQSGPAAPLVTFSADPASVPSGGSSTLVWSSQGATSCNASGAWSGSRAVSGSAGTGPLTASSSFTLTCTGEGGSTISSTSVTVLPPAPAPTLAFSANPAEVSSGGTSTLSWTSTNADSCTASGAWAGNRATSGSTATASLASTSTFTLGCTGAGGSISRSVTVTVVQATPAPSVSFSANPTSVPSGAGSTLSWSSQNASSCTASGAWSGSRPTSGSAGTGALTSNATYTLACSGPGGTTTRSVTVTVVPQVPAPTLTFNANPTQASSGGSSTLSWSSTNADSCTASGGWSGARAPSGSEATQSLSSSQTFNLSCTGAGGSVNRSATVSVTQPGGGSFGLDFPGSAATSGTMRFQFTNPLAIYPATYIWKVYPRQQNGYYTTFFWGNNGSFYWDSGAPNSYYGAHPYPNSQPSGNTHRWEVSVDGGDYVNDANGNNTSVQYGRWHTQALRVWADGSGNKHHEFYWDLPDTSRVIRVVIPSRYGNRTPPSPVLVWGDAPWNQSNEILNGILRGIQVYSANLSLQDVLAEATSPLSTSSGAAGIWYLNLDPTPSDISDKSGKGHHPSWVGSGRPQLWSGP